MIECACSSPFFLLHHHNKPLAYSSIFTYCRWPHLLLLASGASYYLLLRSILSKYFYSYSILIIITYVCLAANDLHFFLLTYMFRCWPHYVRRRWNSTRYRIFVHAVPSVCTQQQQLFFCLLPNETTTCHKQPRAYWRLKTE